MEFLEFFNQYLVLIVMGICLCVGYILKNVVKTDKVNDFIPLIMGILGVVLNVWLNEWAFTPEIFFGGLVSGLASTGAYEGSKNIFNKMKNDSTDEEYNE